MYDRVPADDNRKPSASELAIACTSIDAQMKQYVDNALDELERIADNDCWDNVFAKEGCDCNPCRAKRAVRHLQNFIYPVVRSLREDRLNYGERVYFNQWVSQNTRRPGVNGGNGLLELILSTENGPKPWGHHAGPVPVSQRDMDVATVVVQWLGTNCGRGFIDTCEREIKKQQEARSDFDFTITNEYATVVDDAYMIAAESIANECASTENNRAHVKDRIKKLVKFVIAKERLNAVGQP